MVAFQTWIVWQLRKISYRWYARYQALKLAKVLGKPNTYKCASCQKDYKKEPRKRTITVDHIQPVKDPSKPNAFQDALISCTCGVCEYLRRMFCPVEGLQVLCKDCHDKKTKKEMGVRKKARRSSGKVRVSKRAMSKQVGSPKRDGSVS